VRILALPAIPTNYYDRFYAQAGTLLASQLSDAATDVGSYWMTRVDQRRPPATSVSITIMATQANPASTPIDNLPKAELHLASRRSDSFRTPLWISCSARRFPHAGGCCRSLRLLRLPRLSRNFQVGHFFLRGPEDYALITRNLAERTCEAECRLCRDHCFGGVMLRRTQNVEANFQAIREVAQSVPFSRLRTAWIFDATRQFGHDQAMEWRVGGEAAAIRRGLRFGMGGDELAFPR